VPTLDGVAFIDPRRSEVHIVQAVGRAIHKSEDKTVGTIVIPVFIDLTPILKLCWMTRRSNLCGM
jgi:predicted helicase